MSKLDPQFQERLALVLGLLGNFIAFLVFLAPAPTFYKIYENKSSSGFHSIPYLTALMSTMLLLYYGLLKSDGNLIITINAVGFFIEALYLAIHIRYSSTQARMLTWKMLGCSLGAYVVMVLVTVIAFHESARVDVIGWICAIFNVLVFAAPLSVVRKVIRTRRVEHMPLALSCFLTVCAAVWLGYGLLTDYFIALPNVLGVVFGVVQIAVYWKYKDATPSEEGAKNDGEHVIHVAAGDDQQMIKALEIEIQTTLNNNGISTEL